MYTHDTVTLCGVAEPVDPNWAGAFGISETGKVCYFTALGRHTCRNTCTCWHTRDYSTHVHTGIQETIAHMYMLAYKRL